MKKLFISKWKYVLMIFIVYVVCVTMAYSLDINFPIKINALNDDTYDWILTESHSNELEYTTSAYKQSGEVLFRAGEYKTENSTGNYFISYIKHPFRLLQRNRQIERHLQQ